MYGGFYTRQEQEDANASRLEHNPNRVGTEHAGFIIFGPLTRSVQPAANWQTSGLIGGGGTSAGAAPAQMSQIWNTPAAPPGVPQQPRRRRPPRAAAAACRPACRCRPASAGRGRQPFRGRPTQARCPTRTCRRYSPSWASIRRRPRRRCPTHSPAASAAPARTAASTTSGRWEGAASPTFSTASRSRRAARARRRRRS